MQLASMLRGEGVKGQSKTPSILGGVSWSELELVWRGHTLGAIPPKLSPFVPLRNTYLNIHESTRGEGEARKIPLLNASLAGLGLKVHPPQQVLEARVVAEGVELEI